MTRVGEEMAEWAGGPVLEAMAFYSKAHPGVVGSLAQEIPRLNTASGLFCLLKASPLCEVSSPYLHFRVGTKAH